MSGETPESGSNHLRATGETDRSPDFIGARSRFVGMVNGIFDEVNKSKETMDRPFKYGAAVFGVLGVEREVVDNPFGGVSIMAERPRTNPGLYMGVDPKNGQEVFYLVRPDRSSVEIRRDPILESTVLPENPTDVWDPPTGTSGDILVSFIETQSDGGQIGYRVTASGSVWRLSTDPGKHGMHRSEALQPTDHQSLESATMFLDMARQDIFIK